ncbi:MBT domain-containing protein 1 [Dermatophagoides pteronyssinus]|uniref:MBT domain-containing protein 1 n=1 Tax=Dermatophagoides pteronyssinus TaxID=6956 RepID=A0ABQ8JVW4_DERPT|nr:MBT domain-containing protein 1 [Dermatophagoides pteronyssinus]
MSRENSSYQMDIDLPDLIQDGWKRCLFCRKIGIKDSFYGKNKEYCSSECYKCHYNYVDVSNSNSNRRSSQINNSSNNYNYNSILPGSPDDPLVFQRRCTSIQQTNQMFPIQKNISKILKMTNTKTKGKKSKLSNKLDTDLDENTFIPLESMIEGGMFHQVNSLHMAFELHSFAPVRAFHHTPMNDCWDDLFKNRVVVDVRQPYRDQYWRAELVASFGYFLKCRYLGPGPGQGNSYFLANPRTRKLLPIIERNSDGQIIKRQYVQPNFMRLATIEHIFQLSKNVTTLEKNLHESFEDCIVSDQYDWNIFYETIDPMDASRFLICKIISRFGDWLLVRYEYPDNDLRESKTVWVHPKLGFFRVLGWSQLIGYPIYAPNTYIALSLYTLTKCDSIVDEYLVNPGLFPFEPNSPNHFQIGTYLELLDPLSHRMKIATVVRKLRFGFIVLEYEDQSLINPEKLTQIVQHVTSPLLFPIGFCHRNSIPLFVSNDIRFDSKMINLAQKMKMKAAQSNCFPNIPNSNNIFKQGMILETFNMVGKGIISYAMIDRVVDRLISLRFINQEPSFQMWAEYTSPHIRPFGFTHMLDIDFKSPVQLYIDNIRFADLHTKILQFKTSLREYIRSMNTQLIREVSLANNKNLIPSTSSSSSSTMDKSSSFINSQEPLIKSNNINTNPSNQRPIQTYTQQQQQQSTNSQQIVYKVHGTDFGRLGNMMIRTAPQENKRGHYVHFPSIKIDTSTVIPDIYSKPKQTFSKVFSRNSAKKSKTIDDEDNQKENTEESLSKKVKYDYSEMNQKKKDNFGYNIDESDIVSDNIDKQDLFKEFKEKVYKLAELKQPNLKDLSDKPLEWTVDDVQTFMKNNLIDSENFQFHPSKEINGQKFLQMDHIEFNKSLIESSMSLAIQLHLLKLSLIEHLKLDLNEIFPKNT